MNTFCTLSSESFNLRYNNIALYTANGFFATRQDRSRQILSKAILFPFFPISLSLASYLSHSHSLCSLYAFNILFFVSLPRYYVCTCCCSLLFSFHVCMLTFIPSAIFYVSFATFFSRSVTFSVSLIYFRKSPVNLHSSR